MEVPIWNRSIPFLLVYFAPVLIGAYRRMQGKEKSWPVWGLFLVVFLTGWSVIGWFFALRRPVLRSKRSGYLRAVWWLRPCGRIRRVKSSRRRAIGTMLAIVGGISISAPIASDRFDACAQKGAPTARVCSLQDFGKPLPANPRYTGEPTSFTDPGFMAVGSDNSLLSTSPAGGATGGGTAFKMTGKGVLTVLHPFAGSVTDGSAPRSGLVDGLDGWFYGATENGGNFKVGTIFRTKGDSGTLQVLYSFRNSILIGLKKPCDDGRCPYSPRQRADAAGSYPYQPPVPDGRGNFYGVTAYSAYARGGVLYKLSPPYDSTGFSTLCIFDPRLLSDKEMAGFVCDAKLTAVQSLTMQAGGSTLYGTTQNGNGTVFQATPGGKVTVLHEFNGADGSKPTGIMLASNGHLYGTTSTGGPNSTLGTVWKLDPATRAFSVLTGFKTAAGIVGYGPLSGVVQGKKSNQPDTLLYGTARYGGRYGRGIIFRLGLDGQGFSVIHDFYTAGWKPMTPLVQSRDSAPTFYGLAYEGGTYGRGTFYRLTHAEYPPRATSPVDFHLTKASKSTKDDMVEVWTSVTATQAGGPVTDSTNDGISTKITCRDPHFVQFIYREKISTLGLRLPGTVTPSSGNYALTTDTANKVWHTDAVGKPNAYYDEGPAAGYFIALAGGVTALTIWDQPNFLQTSLFQPSQQDPRASETWRATIRTFAICNCQVKREIRWTLEKVGGKQTYKDISIRPANDSALAWINAQLRQDRFDPVP